MLLTRVVLATAAACPLILSIYRVEKPQPILC